MYLLTQLNRGKKGTGKQKLGRETQFGAWLDPKATWKRQSSRLLQRCAENQRLLYFLTEVCTVGSCALLPSGFCEPAVSHRNPADPFRKGLIAAVFSKGNPK